jgi:nucleotide-binding universal stress UspA family protein
MDIKKLLFVTKFEELGFDALRSLLSLRNSALEHVVFVNVIERDRVAMRRGKGYNKDEEIRLREAANIRFIDWSETLFEEGMEVGVYIVVGSLVPEVIEATQKEDADLIVIGRSHKGVLEHLYSGSDVTELLRRAWTPVLVYKQLSETTISVEEPFERPLLAIDWSPGSLRAVEYLKVLKDTKVLRPWRFKKHAKKREISWKKSAWILRLPGSKPESMFTSAIRTKKLKRRPKTVRQA